MKYGYIRPVDLYDSVEDQRNKLKRDVDEIFVEAHAHNKKRHKLDELLDETADTADHIYVTDLCILADSTKQLADIINSAEEKQIVIHVLNIDLLIDSSTESSFSRLLNDISNFQSDVVRFRTKQGMNNASSKGKQLGRPKRSDDNIKRAVEMYMTKKYTLDEIKEATNISRATLYRHLDG